MAQKDTGNQDEVLQVLPMNVYKSLEAPYQTPVLDMCGAVMTAVAWEQALGLLRDGGCVIVRNISDLQDFMLQAKRSQ